MKSILATLWFCLISCSIVSQDILIEAESFDNPGGWVNGSIDTDCAGRNHGHITGSRNVGGADGLAAFEHHVLEEMADAGNAWPFVGGADMSDPPGADGGQLGALDHEKIHPVR